MAQGDHFWFFYFLNSSWIVMITVNETVAPESQYIEFDSLIKERYKNLQK